MFKLFQLHLGRTLSRIVMTLLLLPLALGELGFGLWLYDGIGHTPLGKLFAAMFIGTGVLLVLVHHWVGGEIDNWRLHRLDRIRLRQRLRGRPRLRAFAMNFA